MPPDILRQIATDFPEAERNEAQVILQLLSDELQTEGKDRILRCVLLLARGKPSHLVHFADRARMDWRDVIFWAEYDE